MCDRKSRRSPRKAVFTRRGSERALPVLGGGAHWALPRKDRRSSFTVSRLSPHCERESGTMSSKKSPTVRHVALTKWHVGLTKWTRQRGWTDFTSALDTERFLSAVAQVRSTGLMLRKADFVCRCCRSHPQASSLHCSREAEGSSWATPRFCVQTCSRFLPCANLRLSCPRLQVLARTCVWLFSTREASSFPKQARSFLLTHVDTSETTL